MRVSLDDHGRGSGRACRPAPGARRSTGWSGLAGFRVAAAGVGGDEAEARAGYEALFARLGLAVDHLVLFSTMDAFADVPEISEGCWDLSASLGGDMRVEPDGGEGEGRRASARRRLHPVAL